MLIEDRVTDPQERIGFRLRSLYSGCGYSRYRMSKFEEYDLYSRNKDFLFSEGVITFTDTNGRLMALKPDVTLSIVKNGKDTPGEVRKLYYHENVYRVSDPEEGFREQTQVGVECLGEVDGDCVTEVLKLAAESLQLCAEEWVLEISSLDLLRAMTEALSPDPAVQKELLKLAGEKNLHGISRLCREKGLDEAAEGKLRQLLSLYGPAKKVLPGIISLAEECGLKAETDILARVADAFDGTAAEGKIQFDFSLTGDMKYYNGVIFRGFISGIPGAVLSGGQYDRLMARMRRKDRAVGFAVFLNMLERLKEEGETDA